MADESPAPTIPQPVFVKRSRSEVGKQVRIRVDDIRLQITKLIDAGIEGVAPFNQAVQDLREQWSELETNLKDWDALPPTEDTYDDLDWRQGLFELSSTFAETFAKEADASFPETGYLRRFQRLRSFVENDKNLLGPATLQMLQQIESRDKELFKYEYVEAKRSLVCRWRTFVQVTLVCSDDRSISSIRVVADGEKEKNRASRFDVIRQLERQARQAMREYWMDQTSTGRDSVIASLIQWFDQRRDLFTASCSSTKRFLAFGAVGERGKLEARPPMLREHDAEGDKAKRFFEDNLM